MEQPLLAYESCNLGSINMVNMLTYDPASDNMVLDIPKLHKTVTTAVHFLDNVIDVNKFPIKQIEINTKKTRKIGLGIMGWADMLVILGIPYNSQAALDMVDVVMSNINAASNNMSKCMAENREQYPIYTFSAEVNADDIKGTLPNRRNLYLNTIAPTGTISMIAGVSSSIEPMFAVSYFKQCLDGNKFMEVNPFFRAIAQERGFYSEELMQKVITSGSIAHIEEIPQDVRNVFVTAHDIKPIDHVKMQAKFQEYIDSSISKTINFGTNASESEISRAFFYAWEHGCKGITVYRDGSRQNQVLNLNEKKKEEPVTNVYPAIRKRPENLNGFTRKMKIGCGSIYVTINHDDEGNIFEVFTTLGKGGGCASQSEATARLASLCCRANVNVQETISQIRGIKCKNCSGKTDVNVFSCPDAIARTMEIYLKKINNDKVPENNIIEPTIESTGISKPTCPECGSEINNESGCITCHFCGWSKCS